MDSIALSSTVSYRSLHSLQFPPLKKSPGFSKSGVATHPLSVPMNDLATLNFYLIPRVAKLLVSPGDLLKLQVTSRLQGSELLNKMTALELLYPTDLSKACPPQASLPSF